MPGEAMTITPATSMPESLLSFIDAASDRIARAVADVHKDAERERELRDAQFAARMAELETRIASVSELERRVADRLATLKDGEAGPAGERGEAGPQGQAGADGKSADPEAVALIILDSPIGHRLYDRISDEVERAVAAIEKPKDGHSPTTEEYLPAIEQAVQRAVSALPAAKNGADGLDGANGKDGADGSSVSLEDVAPIIEEAVQRAVSAIPAPKDGADGRDGKDVDPETIAEMVRAEVAALPPAQPGKDADPELVASLVDEKVSAAMAALPPAEKGEKGDRGEAGPTGKLPIVTAWEDRVYYQGDVVTFEGSVYQAQRDTGRQPAHEDWNCLVKAGADGRSPKVRTTWSETEAYNELDIVILNGGGFIARRNNPGPCPGDGWQLLASQGKQGKPGERGTPGVGLRGEPGLPVVALDVDDKGMVTLTNGDGSTVACDLYPLLSRLG